MTANHSVRYGTAALSLLLAAARLALPAWATPAPEEIPLNCPWLPEPLSADTQR